MVRQLLFLLLLLFVLLLEHGWNDPPQFSYHGSTSKKAISFTKRPTYPADTVPSDSTGRSTLDSSEPPPVVPHLPQTTPINLDSNEMVLLTSDEIIIFLNELTETHRENIQVITIMILHTLQHETHT